jgi:hypothetical protein
MFEVNCSRVGRAGAQSQSRRDGAYSATVEPHDPLPPTPSPSPPAPPPMPTPSPISDPPLPGEPTQPVYMSSAAE